MVACTMMASGCGTPVPPPEHAPTSTHDEESTDTQADPETHESDSPETAFTVTHPFTDLAFKCTKSFKKISHASLPVLTSQEQLDTFLGCKIAMVVDWSKESVVPVAFEGINRAWDFEGLSTQDGVTTITVSTDTINRGAAMHSEAHWLVRVPPATKSVVLEWQYSQKKKDVNLYP
jgi:hypothetical protein